MNKQKIVVITGPTATGKTKLAISVAKAFNGEIISADSMQVYRGLNIGTAKPTPKEQALAPHHMIDMIDPTQPYSLAQYLKDAHTAAADILRRGKLPVLAGGTGLYITSFVDYIKLSEQPVDLQLRGDLEQLTSEKLLEELNICDPQTAARLSVNDRKRILRAVEVYRSTGKTMSQHNEESKREQSPYDPVMIGLSFANRQNLYDRIDARAEQMVEQGIMEEAKYLLSLLSAPTALQAIGYKEMAGVLAGTMTLEQGLDKLKQESRRYAKRQLTWFRRDQRIKWHMADEYATFEVLEQDVMGYIRDIFNTYCRGGY